MDKLEKIPFKVFINGKRFLIWNKESKISKEAQTTIIIDCVAILISEQPYTKERRHAAQLLLNHFVGNWRLLLDEEYITFNRNDSSVRIWRKKVLKRDNSTCVKCGSIEKLHVHHIIHWSLYPKGRNDINNGITLCGYCHAKEHEGEKAEKLILSRL